MARVRSVIGTDDVEVVSPAAPPELNEAGFEPGDIEVVAARAMRDQAAEAKFMEEKVTIEIEADEDPNAPVFIYLGHNGISQYVQRGIPQVVRRKYLYSAIAAKTVKFASAFGKDNSGNEFNHLNPSVKTTHRVRLVEDPNPQGGMKWFQQIASRA